MPGTLHAGTYADDGAGWNSLASGGTRTVTLGAAVTAADCLVLSVICANAGGTSAPSFAVSDSVNGAWPSGNEVKTITSVSGANGARGSLWLFPNSAAGTPVITVTITGSFGGPGCFGGMMCCALTGIATSSVVDASAAGSTMGSTNASSGASGATTASGEFAIGAYTDYGAGTTLTVGTIDSVTATQIGQHGSDGNNWQGLLEYGTVVSSGATPTATATSSAAADWHMLEVVLKIVGGTTTSTRTATPVTAALQSTLPRVATPITVSLSQVGQTSQPASDGTRGNWTTQTGATTALYATVNESSASDADYVQSAAAPATDRLTLDLAALSTPLSGPQLLHYRYSKDAGTERVDLTVDLMQGVTVVQTWTHTDIPTTWTQQDQTVTGTITNYADLHIRLTANQP